MADEFANLLKHTASVQDIEDHQTDTFRGTSGKVAANARDGCRLDHYSTSGENPDVTGRVSGIISSRTMSGN